MDTRIAGSCWWHVGLDTPRSGVEKRMWSPRPRWAGGAVDTRYAGSCWRHVGLDTPTEWGGKENVAPPPPAMGRRRGGPRYAGSC